MQQLPHVEAEITFLPPSEGGRTNPPILLSPNGTYRPHIVIGNPNQRKAITVGTEIRETYLGVVFESGLDRIEFGEPLLAEFVLMYLPTTRARVRGARCTPYARVLKWSAMGRSSEFSFLTQPQMFIIEMNRQRKTVKTVRGRWCSSTTGLKPRCE